MTVWLYCFAALVSAEHEIMCSATDARLMTPEAAFVEIYEAPAHSTLCEPYSVDGRPVVLTVFVDYPTHVRLKGR